VDWVYAVQMPVQMPTLVQMKNKTGVSCGQKTDPDAHGDPDARKTSGSNQRPNHDLPQHLITVLLSMLCWLSMPRPTPDLSIAASTPKSNVGPLPVAASQASREGKKAVTIFVKPEAKAQIKAGLIDGGYGPSFQEGLVALINEMLAKQGRPPIA
jgi:hypothetical protein